MKFSKQSHKKEPLLKDEIHQLESVCQTGDDKMLIFVLLDTGLRISELCGLTRQNIDFQNHVLILTGKGKKRRVVPLSSRARVLLESYFAINEQFPYSIRTSQLHCATLGRQAGLYKKLTPHILRHTFAVLAIQKGLSLPALQKILGHDHLETTAIYLNMQPESALREFKEKW